MISPSKYLELATTPSSYPSDHRVIVQGKVDLRRSPHRASLRVLPKALIQGALCADDCPELRQVSCSTTSHLSLARSGVEEIAPSVEIAGDLSVSGCQRLKCLDGRVAGNVDASTSSVEYFGESFGCGGLLDLFRCHRLTQLAKMSITPADVRLDGSGIKEIHESFACRGNLIIENAERLRLLAGSVGGRVTVNNAPYLDSIVRLTSRGKMAISHCPSLRVVDFSTSSGASFYQCGFRRLSEISHAQGELSIVGCEKFCEIGGSWGGSVTLVDLPALTSLNADLEIAGDLVIRQTPDLQSLSGLVHGDSHLVATGPLRSVGQNFHTKGKLTIEACSAQLRELGCRVDGDLMVVGPSRLESTQSSFRVNGSAIFVSNDCLNVLRGFVAKNVELMRHHAPIKIGADFECGADLLISECQAGASLNCVVGGNTVLKNTPLLSRGPAFNCHGSLFLTPPPWYEPGLAEQQ